MKRLSAILAALLLWGCAQGGTVMLQGAKPEVARPVESVDILLDNPTRPYAVIALVNASAKTENQLMNTRAEAETAAMEELRRQAAEAGADAVFDIQREMIDTGVAGSASEWGQNKTTTSSSGNASRSKGTVSSSASASVNNNYEIIFHAKAIRYKPQ